MYRYLLIFILSFNFSFSNENVVKTSELELFLFKVGFESLLKDVDITKEKSTLNENEIKSINEKIELIMSELYKDKRVLLNDSEELNQVPFIDSKEFDDLKSEIGLLKKELILLKKEYKENLLKEKKVEKVEKIIKTEKVKKTVKKLNNKDKKIKAIITVSDARVRIYPSIEAKIIKEIPKNYTVYLDYCDKFGWCKLSGKREYIAKQVLWIYKK